MNERGTARDVVQQESVMLCVEPSQRAQRAGYVVCDGLGDMEGGMQEREHRMHIVGERELDKVDGALDDRLLMRCAGFEGVRKKAVGVVRLETCGRDKAACISAYAYLWVSWSPRGATRGTPRLLRRSVQTACTTGRVR